MKTPSKSTKAVPQMEARLMPHKRLSDSLRFGRQQMGLEGVLVYQGIALDIASVLDERRQMLPKAAHFPAVSAALENAIADMHWAIEVIHSASNPNSEQPIVWKDVCLQIYAGMNRLPEYRAALKAAQP